MKDDYLWDRTGEPDPEIQQLEETLGTLRYQPRPLEIPLNEQPDARRRLFPEFGRRRTPRLAIAATLVIALLALGVWLGLQRLQRGQAPAVAGSPNTSAPGTKPASTPVHTANKDNDEVKPDLRPEQSVERRRGPVRSNALHAGNANRWRKGIRKLTQDPELAINELREGEAAKTQLMQALRVVSEKLSFAQKKTQNTNSQEPVHNQHKIG